MKPFKEQPRLVKYASVLFGIIAAKVILQSAMLALYPSGSTNKARYMQALKNGGGIKVKYDDALDFVLGKYDPILANSIKSYYNDPQNFQFSKPDSLHFQLYPNKDSSGAQYIQLTGTSLVAQPVNDGTKNIFLLPGQFLKDKGHVEGDTITFDATNAHTNSQNSFRYVVEKHKTVDLALNTTHHFEGENSNGFLKSLVAHGDTKVDQLSVAQKIGRWFFNYSKRGTIARFLMRTKQVNETAKPQQERKQPAYPDNYPQLGFVPTDRSTNSAITLKGLDVTQKAASNGGVYFTVNPNYVETRS